MEAPVAWATQHRPDVDGPDCMGGCSTDSGHHENGESIPCRALKVETRQFLCYGFLDWGIFSKLSLVYLEVSERCKSHRFLILPVVAKSPAAQNHI